MRKKLLLLFIVIGWFVSTAAEAQYAQIPNYPRHVTVMVQQRLHARGYNPGPVDGVWGPMTSRCLRRYQLDHRLPPTGDLNPPTARSLNIPMRRPY